MSNLFFKATGFQSSKTGLQKLSSSSKAFAKYEYESAALAHWIFDESSESLKDGKNKSVLTLQSGATVNPEFTKSGVVISGKLGNSLISEFTDDVNQDITFSIVVKVSVASTLINVLFGNVTASGSNQTGMGLWIANTAPTMGLRNLGGTSTNIEIADLKITSDDYIFISGSYKKSSKTMNLLVFRDGQNVSKSEVYTVNYTASSNKFSIGNQLYTQPTQPTNNLTVVEAMIHHSALTSAEQLALAQRCAARMLERGLTL